MNGSSIPEVDFDVGESFAGSLPISSDPNDTNKLFFWFFPPGPEGSLDDLIFWTNGGPGGSSSIGLFMELGPCRVTGPSNTTFHPESWNAYSNIFFIDQPVGVGFSYAEHGEHVVRSVSRFCGMR